MLDVVKLATLRTVVERGSFSAAAAALHLSQPGVSRQIGALERQLGTALVRRGRRGVTPTEAGRVLLDHAAVALARLEVAEDEVRALRGLRRGTVRMGSFFSALARLSAEVTAQLGQAHPGIALVDELVDRTAAMDRLGRGELDLAIVFEHDVEPAAPVDGIEVRALFDDPLRVVLPADHRLARLDRIAVADLAALTWIRPLEGSAARLVDHVLTRAGVHPPVLLAGRGDEPVEAQALVAAGKGIALTHDLTVVIDPARLVLRPLAGWSSRRQVQVAVSAGPRAPAVDAALRAVLTVGDTHRRRLARPG